MNKEISTFHALLSHCMESYAKLPAMQNSIESLTFAELIERACRFVAYVVGQKERYFILRLSSPIDYAAAFLGVILSKRIVCLLPDGHEIPVQIKRAHVITDVTAGICDDIPFQPLTNIEPGNPDEPCAVAFSSGTSAEAKCVLLSQTNLLLSARYGASRHGFWRGERLVHVLPYWHLFGLAADLIAPLLAGSCVYIPDSPLEFFSALRKYKPHSVNVPPALAATICNAIESAGNVAKVTGGSLKKLLSAGAPLDPIIAHKLLSYGISPCTAYGLTECSPCVSITAEDEVRIGTSGRPIDCIDVRIAEDGEVLVRGGIVMLGYLGDTEATNKRIRDGWFYTGDIGCFDEAGHLMITGRKSSMLVFANGTKCIPEVVEERITALPRIDECLLSCTQDGIYAVLTVVTSESEIPCFEKIDRIMQDAGIPVYKTVKQKEKLIRNQLGKVVRHL